MASGNPNPAAQYLAKAIPTLPSGPCATWQTVTKADSGIDAAGPFRALWVTVTGDVTYIDLEDNVVVATGVPAFTIIEGGCKVVKLATTATVKGGW